MRHSYRSWLDAVGTPVAVHQKLMRHADIRTTMNIYGDIVKPMRCRKLLRKWQAWHSTTGGDAKSLKIWRREWDSDSKGY